MSWQGAAKKWLQRGVGFTLPLAAAPYPVDNLFQAGPLASRFPQMNWGAMRGGVAAGVVTWHQIGGPQRLVDVALQRGQTGDHWDNSPKNRMSRRHTHGYFVSPSSRVERNPSQGRWDVVQQDYARRGVVWMP